MHPKARKVTDHAKWKREHDYIVRETKWWEGSCLVMEEEGKEHPVTRQPTKGEIKKITDLMRAWETVIKQDQDGGGLSGVEKERVVGAITAAKRRAYGGATQEAVERSTEHWAGQWQQWVGLECMHATFIEQATRYLGVFST